ncbi:MAG TPA: deoxyribonuclease IV, partial [Kofleriaceae bacterium]|nr:deoxyribonuclease IV [Kofleriaceae bacterium]
MPRPDRIVSGGQTGADRGALDAAIELGVPHGGWCPRGRRAEDGRIPARYDLRETESAAYAVRTGRNVVDSDGTLLVTRGAVTGGSALTASLAVRHRRPLLHVDLDRTAGVAAVAAVRTWMAEHRVRRLNVAGPRASHTPGIADDVRRLLVAVLGARLRLGAHTSIAGGLHRALERGAATGCDVVQIFTRSNQQWAAPALDDDRLGAWRTARAGAVEPVLVHGSYLCNLATGDRVLRERSYQALELEALRAARLGIPYLVIHPGAHGGAGVRTGLRRIAAALDRLHAAHPDLPTTVLLENTAGQGTSVGWRFEELRDLFASVRAPDRLGVCIDTCHLLAAGHDVRTPDAWDTTFSRFDRVVGCARVRAFHVNDSKVPLGGRVDRHQGLGHGELGLGAFHCLVNDPRFVGLPMVLETPKPSDDADVVNLGILRALHGRA